MVKPGVVSRHRSQTAWHAASDATGSTIRSSISGGGSTNSACGVDTVTRARRVATP